MDDPKPLVWLHGEIKTPPFSADARLEAGFLLRRLQNGEKLALPQSRPMPVVGSSCHELRIRDADQTWRVIYSIEDDAVVILEVFSKKTATTPKPVITTVSGVSGSTGICRGGEGPWTRRSDAS